MLVLNLLVALLFFLIFPGAIVYKGAEEILKGHERRVRLEEISDMQTRLDELQFFAGEGRFAHFILSSLCKNPSGELIELKTARLRMNMLEKKYPGNFSFVVADKGGKILEELSTFKGYRYLFRQFFSFVSLLARTVAINDITDLEMRLRRLRPLVGNLLRAEDLLLPLQAPRSGRSILVSGAKKRHHLWYGSGRNFNIAVFIDYRFIQSDTGLRWAAEKINRLRPDLITGFSIFPPDSQTVFPKQTPENNAYAIRAIAEFETVQSASLVESDRPVVCRFLSQKWRGFCFKRERKSPYADARLAMINTRIFAFVMIFAFVAGIHQLINPIRLTVKLKLFVLFAYAIVLPLLIIGSIAGEYIQQTENRILNEMRKKVFRKVETLEEEYAWYIADLENRYNKFFAQAKTHLCEKQADGDWLKSFEAAARKLGNYDQFFLWDSSGKDLMGGISPRVFTNSSLLKRIGVETLEIILSSHDPGHPLKFEWSAYSFASDRISRDGRIFRRGVGDLDFMMYSTAVVGSDRSFSNSFSASLFWSELQIQKNFITLRQSSIAPRSDNSSLQVFTKDSDELIYASATSDASFNRIVGHVKNGGLKESYRIAFEDQDFVVFSAFSRSLNRLKLVYIFPAELIQMAITDIYTISSTLFLIMIFLAGWSAYLLNSWISRPLGELIAGVKAIAGRNFNHRLVIHGENELAQLSMAFNSSLETLQDLEIARIVQESLMPLRQSTVGDFQVLGDTSVMTRLCGDYFDLVKLDDNRMLVFIGDATGHGIPAAITMSMVKTVLLNEAIEGIDQEKLMERLHLLFKHLRTQGSKECMTSISAIVDSSNSQIRLINFGHCYPIIHRPSKNVAELLSDIRGLPPGFSRTLKMTPVSITLEPGETLFLYTDGLIECCNPAGQILGFEGLQSIIVQSHSEDMGVYCQRIKSAVRAWENEAADDQTILLVRRK